MKKSLVLHIALLLLLINNVCAQGELQGQSFFRIQFVQPLGEYKDYYNSGIGLEAGRFFPLRMEMASGKIVPGLDITFIHTSFNTGKDFSYFSYSEDNINFYDFKSQGGFLWNIGVKIGPMITVGITDGLLADFSVQYDPTVVINSRKGIDNKAWTDNGFLDAKRGTSVCFSHRVSLKADIRYTNWMFGLEFMLGNTALEYNNDIIPYRTTSGIRFRNDKDMGMGALLLNLGYSF